MSRLPIVLFGAALVMSCASERENVVHVIAEKAPGLKKASRVQFRGVDVGMVKQVYFTPSGVRIDLLIERGDVPIRSQDTVRIAMAGAFGQQVVDITPGVQTAPLLSATSSATLPKVRADSTISLPLGVWQSVVRTLGSGIDTTDRDTVIVSRP